MRVVNWGIFVVGLWAVALAFLVAAQLLQLTVLVQIFSGEEGPSQIRLWVVFILNLLFFFGFAASAYGLFKRYNWGRLLFLGVIAFWTAFNLVALFSLSSASQDYTVGELALNILRYAATLLAPLIYLSLPRVKAAFNQSTKNLSSEESLDDHTL